MSQREQLDTGLNTYNDSQWHVLTVTHNTSALKLVVDDFDYFRWVRFEITEFVSEKINVL